ncbi:MAG: NUDIX domain-containing protein [Proteobacteria bacterium]|nr:NUDIX domain-containing protein [Pseudomonadota bacterium]
MKERIHAVLAARERKVIHSDNLTPAAILLPLFRKERGCYVLFTKRTETVKHHKGEISFPGGAYDQEDKTLQRTALRESFEEIGLKERDVELLGCLDDVETLTRYLIRPFVGVFPHPYAFEVNRHEIEEIIEVPLESLLEKDRFEEKRIFLDGGERTVFTYRYGKHLIWGATAKILKQFLDLIQKSA